MAEPEFGSLSGMRAVITGSSSGIGRAIALEFAAAGASVVVHCRKAVEQAESVVSEIRSCGGQAEFVTADLAAVTELDDFVERVWACFSGIEIWVNNAGVDLLTGDARSLDYQTKLSRLLDVDVRATLLLSKRVGRRLADEDGGSLLNIGWDQADRGMEGDSGELFSTAKNAVMGATRSLAVTLAPQVRVNCIAPGWIRTAWGESAGMDWQERVLRETPLARWGTPEDVALMARFLVSRSASYITGQVINVNGGSVR